MVSSLSKLPRPVFNTVYAFPPNRDTLGGTAYLLLEETGNLLIDCPAWDEGNTEFLKRQGVRWLLLTHRGGMGKVKDIQQALNCEVVIQEQEAYLLPGLTLTPFEQEFRFSPHCQAIWTSGHSPGSACLYCDYEGGILFTGRHLLPNQQGEPVPLRISKTFHWKRQIESARALGDRFSAATLSHICPGANTGFLRGQRSIDRAYERLAAIDWQAHLSMKPML
ncbi:MAG: MBL fold metallo-hydrolase [Leptolyngbyaceae cyanobacterium CSU_1_4]|nr:MBL fold metallo-hydrolase [Leptolyngbyaceae cyanobacterium CSU_1_4]